MTVNTTVRTSRFGAWLRDLDTFTARLVVMQRAPEAIDVCEDAAEEAALCEGDPDGDETDEQTSEPAPAASTAASTAAIAH